MPIQIKIFGDLKKKFPDHKTETGIPLLLSIEESGITYIEDILSKFGISKDETSHIFVNSRYSGFRKKVVNGDRVSFFPRNMSLLYKWYFSREEDD